MGKSNLTPIKGAGKSNDFKDSVRAMTENLPDYIEYIKIDA